MDSEEARRLVYVEDGASDVVRITREQFAKYERLQELVTQLRLELHRERMASLRRGHRPAGRVVHHIDGDVHNNDPGNLMIVDPADRWLS